MMPPAYSQGGGYMPAPNFGQQKPAGYAYSSAAFSQFPGVLDAVAALPPRLNKLVWNLHHRYGVPLDIALGNVLGVLSFVCQGVSNALDSKGDPMPQSAIVHVVGVPFSGKSVTFLRLMGPVEKTMADWPHQWDFEDSTPQGIKREAPVLGLCAHEEGDAFFPTAFGKDLALQISLRDGRIPVVTRAKRQEGDRKKKGVTRFTTIVLIQPDRYDEWLNGNRRKAVGAGFLQRVWMVRSYLKSDKSAIGRYPQSEGGLDHWDERVSELLELAKENGNSGLANLQSSEVASDASHVLNQAQQRIDFLDAQGVFRDASAMAARYQERASVLAGMFHLYEGEGQVINRTTMFAATVVADYLAGQWLDIVFPPAPPPQDEQDKGVLLPLLHAELSGRRVSCIRETEVVTLAKNMKWAPTRTRAALMNVYATGHFRLVPRTINGRTVNMIELPTYLPPPANQVELDAGELLPQVHAELRRRGERQIGESEVVTLAKNLGWVPERTKSALRMLYAARHFRLVPRTINGRVIEMIEMIELPPRLI